MSAESIRKELRSLATPEKANISKRFFKTEAGHYGAGDIFFGISVGDTRKVAEKYRDTNLKDIRELLYSKIHEERLCALLILVLQFEKGNKAKQKEIFNFYIKNAKQVNNWDLVDTSARTIVGTYLLDTSRTVLTRLAHSKNLWEKRIAIIATFAFIKEKQYKDTFLISEILMQDTHDLIHKAVGWMLREVGNQSLKDEELFLKKHYKTMPRTMLRYATEKFPEQKRQRYLKGKM